MWTKEIFGTDKPIIAMLHLLPLPGDPKYVSTQGMKKVMERAFHDLNALQNGGVDGILISNEFSLPYLYDVDASTIAGMARVIGQLIPDIKIPYGVDVIMDPYKVFDMAVAVEAKYVRETFTGVYAGDYGLVNYEIGKIARHRANVGAQDVKTMFTLVPECSKYLVNRDISDIAKSTMFYGEPDALLVAGLIAGHAADSQTISIVKSAIESKIPVFANTGVRLENVDVQLAAADGAIVGTTFKRDGYFYNEVDESRVKVFMDKVKGIRGSL